MAQFGQDPVTVGPPAKCTPQERHQAGEHVARTATRLAPTRPAARTAARIVLDVLGILQPLRDDRNSA